MNLWIERYLQALGDELDSTNKDEIVDELRANILDALDAERAAQGGELSDEQIKHFVQQQTAPKILANQLAPQAPLIASRYMTQYKHLIRQSLTWALVLAFFIAAQKMFSTDTITPITYLLNGGKVFIDLALWLVIGVSLYYAYQSRADKQNTIPDTGWLVDELPELSSITKEKDQATGDFITALFGLMICTVPWWMDALQQAHLVMYFNPDYAQWRYIFLALFLLSLVNAMIRLHHRFWRKSTLKCHIVENSLFAITSGYVWWFSLPIISINTSNISWFFAKETHLNYVFLAIALVSIVNLYQATKRIFAKSA